MSIDWDIRCSEGLILADTWFQQIANILPGSVLVPGECHFDSQGFLDLVQFLENFPEEVDFEDPV